LKKTVDPLAAIDRANVCTSRTNFSQWLEKPGIEAVFLSYWSGWVRWMLHNRLKWHQRVARANARHGTESVALLLESTP
jgi:hypothetical protein